MAWNVYPTNTPVGSYQGESCEEMQEFQHAEWLNHLHQSPLHSFRCSGGVFTYRATNNIDIPLGTYIIDGRVVYIDAADSLAITATRPTYIFARLLKTGDLVTSGEYYSNTTGSLPSEPHVLMGAIGYRLSSGDEITVSETYPRVVTGSFTGTGGSTRKVWVGFSPKKVELTESVAGYCAGIVGGIGLTTRDFGVDSSDVIAPTDSNTYRPTLDTFGFTAPALWNGSGDTVYWTAWA